MKPINRRTLLLGIGAAGVAAATLGGVSAPARIPAGLKLGKNAASSDQVALKAGFYYDRYRIPTPPANFGHYDVVPRRGWGALGNDMWGNCVMAGAAHEHQVWSRLGQDPADFTYANVMQAYSDVTGFDPNATRPDGYNPTDTGTYMAPALKYRRNHGIYDSLGRVQRIEAYAALDPGDSEMLAVSSYMFSAVGVGFTMPMSAMMQFALGEPWDMDVDGHSRSEEFTLGGHYVPVIGRKDGYFVTVSWGRLQLMSPEFYATWCDEAYAMFDHEFLHDGQSPEGFNRTALLNDLEEITS